MGSERLFRHLRHLACDRGSYTFGSLDPIFETRGRVLAAGATFQKVDLHVHTPASADVTDAYGDPSPLALVQRATDLGLNAIAVTDHNTIDGCEAVIAAAQGNDITVFPGVEITTPEGHLLAIFDPSHSLVRIRDLLTTLGIGSGSYGTTEALANCPIDRAAEAVVRSGGLAIAAHIHSPAGFWSKTDGIRRRQIHQCESIAAYEVRDPAEAMALQSGSIQGYERKVPCIQASDSWADGADCHSLAGLGTRTTVFKMRKPTMRALRHALLDPHLRVRPHSTPLLQADSYIASLSVTGGFLDGEEITFSPDLTALIGGTGTGKSLAIELIRFALDQQISAKEFPAIRREVDDRLRFTLGEGSTARVRLVTRGGNYFVERAWAGGGAADPVLFHVVGDRAEAISGVDVSGFFPIRAFSQSEVIEYARQPIARLALIDAAIDLSVLREDEDRILRDLHSNAEDIVALETEVFAAEEALRRVDDIGSRVASLSAFFEAEEVEAQGAWKAEGAYLDDAAGAISSIARSVAEVPSPNSLPLRPEETPNSASISSASGLVDRAVELVSQGCLQIVAALEAVAAELNAIREQWRGQQAEFDQKIQELLAAADADAGQGLASLNRQLQRLQGEQAELAQVRNRLDTDLRPRRTELSENREALLDALMHARQTIRDRRRARAASLNIRIGNTVRISVDQWVQRQPCYDGLIGLRTGSNVTQDQIKAISESCHPMKLVRSMLAGDYTTPAKLANLDPSVLSRLHTTIVERGRTLELYQLQTAHIDDGVSIQFALNADTYRPIEALAHGQKCTAVLVVAMAEGAQPLIVDQPEDALHAPWIERYLVDKLRVSRGERQCVFATRSANIVVSANCEQIVCLEATADHGRVDKSGSLEEFETADLVVHHVEGGRLPFERRSGTYRPD